MMNRYLLYLRTEVLSYRYVLTFALHRHYLYGTIRTAPVDVYMVLGTHGSAFPYVYEL
jgi:hypothetical protein